VLMRLRNSHPAFDGCFELHQCGDTGVSMAWRNGEHYCRLYVDLPTHQALIDYLDPVTQQELRLRC
jgi:glucosylglycerol phosphorylase (configuration-retaining)